MKFSTFVIFFSLTCHHALAKNAEQEVEARKSRHQISAEGLGPGGLYSLYYSHLFTDDWAFNVGLSYAGLFFAAPLSGSYLMGDGASKFELNAGLSVYLINDDIFDFFSFSDDSSFNTVALAGVFGLGYRYWPMDGGFHFRLMGYLLTHFSAASPWGGISFGYAF